MSNPSDNPGALAVPPRLTVSRRSGPLGGHKAVVVAARGVALGADYPAAEYDFQVAYMAAWCRMVGITDVSRVEVEKTLYGPEANTTSRAAAEVLAARI